MNSKTTRPISKCVPDTAGAYLGSNVCATRGAQNFSPARPSCGSQQLSWELSRLQGLAVINVCLRHQGIESGVVVTEFYDKYSL